ncbi:CHAT domain-containing protein [Streptomyces roseolilacinus]|uniref:CHAT domain-containing protein n=1 Tax=Streptomyces roseolilacinus TaxID=66904 RepID=A0A918EJP1_9ACTN|nr:CHAT domain-containing protein [Streptomyces roseolilacinus]GGQ07512.1 hypothetical protein GCM10010249_27220 [Streptomyces roseolilacinus]
MAPAVQGVWAALGPPGDDPLCAALVAYVAAFDWRRRADLLDAHPGLLGDRVDEVLDRLATTAPDAPETGGDPRPGTWAWTFACHRDTLRFVRARGEYRDLFDHVADDPSEIPGIEEAARLGGSAEALLWRGETLLRLRRHEEASRVLARAAEAARRDADHAAEGDAELMLCRLEHEAGSPVDPGRLRRVVGHAQRAEAAFRRADRPEGVAHALVFALGCAADERDDLAVRHLLDKLRAVDEAWWRWWDAYTAALRAWAATGDTEGLVWCRDHAHTLGPFGEGLRESCACKVDFSEGGAAVLDRLLTGPPPDRIETERLRLRSQVRQREASAAHFLTYLLAARRAQDEGDWATALDVLERNTSRGLLHQAPIARRWAHAPNDLRTEADEGNEGFFDALARHFDAPGPATAKLLRHAMRDRRERDRVLEERLVAAVPGADAPVPRPVTTAEVAARLPRGHEVVLYTPTGSVVLLDRDGPRFLAPYDTDAVHAAAARLRGLLTDPAGGDPLRSEAARYLGRALTEPVRGAARGSRLSVVPTGALWGLPLGVLGARPLDEDRDLGYVPSLSVLTAVLERKRLRRRVERFVGVADPDGSLRHARAELLDAARHFADATTLVGDEVALRPALANLEDADVAHIACHGLTFPDHPEYSALRIASGPPRARFLLAQDAGGLRLNARLVVLAACHSGSSLSTGGDEYVGFPGVFLMAGARCVVAPLWAVDDASTARVMSAFHEALAAGGTPAAALRAARRRVAEDPATAHPYHWAAFQTFGVSP